MQGLLHQHRCDIRHAVDGLPVRFPAGSRSQDNVVTPNIQACQVCFMTDSVCIHSTTLNEHYIDDSSFTLSSRTSYSNMTYSFHIRSYSIDVYVYYSLQYGTEFFYDRDYTLPSSQSPSWRRQASPPQCRQACIPRMPPPGPTSSSTLGIL